ncbi:MAG TPA: hypothetical protein VF710_06365 [Longimicrobium sp.]|jgi:hypothetical protein
MKVAVLSESSADEAAVRLLVEAVLGSQTTSPEPLTLRSRGWPAVRDVLPAIIRHLHFQTDVEGLVVVADSDRSVVHTVQHDMVEGGEPRCRVCELRSVHALIRGRLAERVGRGALKVAFGVAVPAVEGWYARGVVPHVNEAAWSRALQSGQFPYTKVSLKETVYGTARPSILLETERAVAAANRLANDIGGLEADFPGGFGALAADLRRWL